LGITKQSVFSLFYAWYSEISVQWSCECDENML
jgi:hypothetical protein